MKPFSERHLPTCPDCPGWRWVLASMALTVAVYWSGLAGGFLFDDYPNIVSNPGVQPQDASVSSLVRAALSSPSSDFKRPLASLSFAINFLAAGLDPFWMKLTNLAIHLLNGLLVFLLARSLLLAENERGGQSDDRVRAGKLAALVAAGWLLLPINLTGVLYVVQRMESMANLFALLGLLGYVSARRRMLARPAETIHDGAASGQKSLTGNHGLILCAASIVFCTAAGLLAKETAVMLPLYAGLIEWILFRFRTPAGQRDNRLLGMFAVMLVLPMIAGLAWLLPHVLNPRYWSTRDFDLRTRLLSETRIVIDYIRWTLAPTPDALSFYHDDFRVSRGLLTPWTTLACMALLGALLALLLWLRQRRPMAALGIALFLGCQLLTGTILPLELIYEHRNYFASFGLMLAVIPLLAPSRSAAFALPRHVLLGGLMLSWIVLTAITAHAWGNPLRLAEELASRAPNSPRAQYELGRTYIIYSKYDPASAFTPLAYAPLEKAAALPDSSILPEQALIFMNARMHLPLKDAWWDSMIAKLKAHKPGVQDESSLSALSECARKNECDLPRQRMVEAFIAALGHPDPTARLLANYGNYAWNVLDDHELGQRMIQAAVEKSPDEPAYQITLIRMLTAQNREADARVVLKHLEHLNIGGRLDSSLLELSSLPGLR